MPQYYGNPNGYTHEKPFVVPQRNIRSIVVLRNSVGIRAS